MLTQNLPSYEQAVADSRSAIKAFAAIARDYRARKIGEKEFLAAHAEHQEAMRKFDEVFSLESVGASA